MINWATCMRDGQEASGHWELVASVYDPKLGLRTYSPASACIDSGKVRCTLLMGWLSGTDETTKITDILRKHFDDSLSSLFCFVVPSRRAASFRPKHWSMPRVYWVLQNKIKRLDSHQSAVFFSFILSHHCTILTCHPLIQLCTMVQCGLRMEQIKTLIMHICWRSHPWMRPSKADTSSLAKEAHDDSVTTDRQG